MAGTHQDFDLCLEKRDRNRFVAFVPHSSRGRAAEHAFTLRTDTLKMREDLQRLEAFALHKMPVKDDFHARFGQTLFEAALGGDVGALFAERLVAARAAGLGLRTRLRVHAGAPELMNLPWELLHDGEGFLAIRWETPVTRMPLGGPRRRCLPLDRTPRMLAVVSNPLNLPSHRRLNTEREQEVILAALDKLHREGVLELDFCENATLSTIQDYLSERDYDILQFTGHGVYNGVEGRGEILLEDARGNMKPLADQEFTHLSRGYPTLRLVVLGACQSANSANNNGYAWVARLLAQGGVPAVLSMQYPVLDEWAIPFSERFFSGLVEGKALDVALTEARLALRLDSGQGSQMAAGEEGLGGMDFATPVLYLDDPACLKVIRTQPVLQDTPPEVTVDWGAVPVMDGGFVGRRQETRNIRYSLTNGRQRALVLYGPGGIGKSALATQVARGLSKRFRGVKAVRITPPTRPDDILFELNAFLNTVGVTALNALLRSRQPLKIKTAAMAQILTETPLLLVFDNLEDVLRGGQVAGDSAASDEITDDLDEFANEALAGFFEQLINGVPGGSRFIFTSRTNFNPAGGGLAGGIAHIRLDELPFPLAVQCMNRYETLGVLPVAPPHGGEVEIPISKRELYNKLGGHPYNILLFARRAAVRGASNVWLEIADVERTSIGVTLLDRINAQLSPRAQTLLLRASALEETPTLEILQWVMGDDKDASPAIDAELNALLGWGLLVRQETGQGEALYLTPAPVRDWAWRQLKKGTEDEAVLLLRAREHHFRAGEYVQMDDTTLELEIENEDDSEQASLTSPPPATNARQEGESHGEVRARIERDLANFTQQGDQHGMATSLGQLGRLDQEQGDYPEALEKHVQALSLLEQLESPGAQIARNNLARLREEMGEGAFAAAMAGLDDETKDLPETGDLPVEQVLGFVVYNTLTVLTEDSEEREEWRETMEGLHFRAQMQNDQEFAAFLGAALEVVKGSNPAQVKVALQEPFAEVWRQLVDELQRGN